MEEARGQADGASDAAWNEYGRPSGQSDRDTPQIGVDIGAGSNGEQPLVQQ
jgi:hypothetical protein